MRKVGLGNNKGISMIEALILIGLSVVFIAMALNFSTVLIQNTKRLRSSSTQSRVLSGIRELARMPATLRASVRASTGGVSVNSHLFACVGGATLNGCKNGVETPFTMYYPVYPRSSTGSVLGVQPISAPLGSTTPLRMDSYGVPCSVAGPDCALLVYTSFKPQCGPTQVATMPTTITADQLLPASECTVADVIEVTFYVQLDPAITPTEPGLASFINQTKGTVTVSVVKISGNKPQ